MLDTDPQNVAITTATPGTGGDARARLTVAGELDLATAPRLAHALHAVLDAGHDVELELSGLRFIDSSGIRVLVHGWQSFADAGRTFVLRPPLPAQMRKVLEVAGLLERLPIDSP